MCFYSCQIDDGDDEDGDGSKVSDNLRQKLVPKENKVVSKNLEKAYIQLVAERNSFLMAGHMICSWLAIRLDYLCFNVICQQFIAMCVEI